MDDRKGALMKMKPKAFLVVSAWNNDVSWVGNYTKDYIIYDKSHTLNVSNTKIIQPKNVGYNIWDMGHFITENYDNLPELVAFLNGNPFDHCKKETFDKLIYNDFFTPLEDYSHVAESYAHKKAKDGGYMEINNSWYIQAHCNTYGQEVNKYFKNYNDFLDEMFINPEHPKWIRFAPGAQYLIPKENILYYSKNFYKKIMGFVDYHRIPSEGHIIERALYYIFTNRWQEKNVND
jgi:hypothetical protein